MNTWSTSAPISLSDTHNLVERHPVARDRPAEGMQQAVAELRELEQALHVADQLQEPGVR